MSEFSMFYNLFGCMHACILHVLSVRLTRVVFAVSKLWDKGPRPFRTSFNCLERRKGQNKECYFHQEATDLK